MTIFQAILLAIVEGITEFLPISSTGHMIIASSLMGIQNETFTKVFEVAIQFGAILSVVVIYFKRFFQSFDFYLKLLAAFIPTAILGVLLKKYVDEMLGSVTVVAIALLLGGFVLIFIDKWLENHSKRKNMAQIRKADSMYQLTGSPVNMADKNDNNVDLSYTSAFWIGVFQTIAFIPGVSRSAATIIGGILQGLDRRKAAEFSFFLAVPTMFASTVKQLWDERELLKTVDITPLIVGNVVAFLVAIIAIKFFISFLTKYGFKFFGYYRIVVGAILLILLALGYDLKLT